MKISNNLWSLCNINQQNSLQVAEAMDSNPNNENSHKVDKTGEKRKNGGSRLKVGVEQNGQITQTYRSQQQPSYWLQLYSSVGAVKR